MIEHTFILSSAKVSITPTTLMQTPEDTETVSARIFDGYAPPSLPISKARPSLASTLTVTQHLDHQGAGL